MVVLRKIILLVYVFIIIGMMFIVPKMDMRPTESEPIQLNSYYQSITQTSYVELPDYTVMNYTLLAIQIAAATLTFGALYGTVKK